MLAGILLLVAVVASRWLVPLETKAVSDHIRGFPESDAHMHRLRPVVLAGLLFLPAFSVLLYLISGTLARWMAKQWLGAFGVCSGGIFLIFLLLDFSTNASRFADASVEWGVMRYYGSMVPAIIYMLLPFVVLLSVLLCMSRISRTRELVAALQSGRGMLVTLAPVYIAAALTSIFSLGLSFHLAPQADGMKRAMLDEIRGRTGKLGENIVHYHPKGRRMWKVGGFPLDYLNGKPLQDVEVTTLNKDGSLSARLYAREANWREEEGGWVFRGVDLTTHEKNEAPFFVKPQEPYVREKWSETPANIWKTGADVRYMGLADLSGYLGDDIRADWKAADLPRYRTQWHNRLAQPFSCLVFAMLGIPLAMYVTRRSGSGGIAMAVICSILLMLLHSVFLAFGESGNVPAAIAVWSPTAFFAMLGMGWLRRRINGRQLWPLW